MEQLTNILINNTGTVTGVFVWLIVFYLMYRLIVTYLGNRSRLEGLRIQQETERILRLKKLENDKTQAGLTALKELADSVGDRMLHTVNHPNKVGYAAMRQLLEVELEKLHKTIIDLGRSEVSENTNPDRPISPPDETSAQKRKDKGGESADNDTRE